MVDFHSLKLEARSLASASTAAQLLSSSKTLTTKLPELPELVLSSRPDLHSALRLNPFLSEGVWFKLYSFKPKPNLTDAVFLAARPLEQNQIQHLLRERRQMVWAAAAVFNYLPDEMLEDLKRKGRFDPRMITSASKQLREGRTLYPSSSALNCKISNRAASSKQTSRLVFQTPDEVLSYLIEELGTDSNRWSSILSMLELKDLSLAALVKTVKALE